MARCSRVVSCRRVGDPGSCSLMALDMASLSPLRSASTYRNSLTDCSRPTGPAWGGGMASDSGGDTMPLSASEEDGVGAFWERERLRRLGVRREAFDSEATEEASGWWEGELSVSSLDLTESLVLETLCRRDLASC